VRRLRARAPHAKLVAGLWEASDPMLTASRGQEVFGEGRYVASLADALEAVVALLGAGAAPPNAAPRR
jgi:hypothetical protein